jgi:uncharacterized protein DUF2332
VEPYGPVAEEYAEFAEDAAAVSPCFDEWGRAVAGDEEVLGWLSTLPSVKRQPNLVFAAARWHGVPAPGPYAGLRAALLGDDGAIRATILSRRTQTNEVGRLATLVPVLARIEAEAGRPLALVEAGASAGLCLHPDRYAYRWAGPDGDTVLPLEGAPELTCRVVGPAPLPDRHPRIAWRAGVDLHPLDVTDADAAAWLETLVWPEEHDRRALLRKACAVARSEPPDLRAGDLLDSLPDLVSEAERHGEPVVFHSAVIAYLEPDDRRRFVALMTGLVTARPCRWVSNEAPEVLPEVTAPGLGPPPGPAQFVLGLDGCALAWAHGHGGTLAWLA